MLLTTLGTLAAEDVGGDVILNAGSARRALVGRGVVAAAHESSYNLLGVNLAVTLGPTERALAGADLSITYDAGIGLSTTCIGSTVAGSAVSNYVPD